MLFDDVSLSLIGCWYVAVCDWFQGVSKDTSGRLHLTSLEYAGDSTLYVSTSKGQVSAWDTRQNTCFMHWQADSDSTNEIGYCVLLYFDIRCKLVIVSRHIQTL